MVCVDDRLGPMPHGLDVVLMQVGGCIEPSARSHVCHDEEHVIDDDAANLHRLTLSTPGLCVPRSAVPAVQQLDDRF
jgi:hypothetical protein